jgi:hypothetical protein
MLTVEQSFKETNIPIHSLIHIPNTTTDKTFAKVSYRSQQEQNSNKQVDTELMEDSDSEEFIMENPNQIEDDENSNQLVNSDKIVSTKLNKNEIDTTNEFFYLILH